MSKMHLLAISPHLKVLGACESLAAESCGSLLSATFPGAVGSIDIVEAGYATLNAKVLVVVYAELLCGQLLQTIGILWLQAGKMSDTPACVHC